jgi:hypothetical protein
MMAGGKRTEGKRGVERRGQPGNMTRRQKDVLGELERLARRMGLKVSSGRLLFAGLKLKGGRCSLREQPWLILDRQLPYEDQVETYKRAFLEMAPATGIPDDMVRSLSREVRELAALTVRSIGLGPQARTDAEAHDGPDAPASDWSADGDGPAGLLDAGAGGGDDASPPA